MGVKLSKLRDMTKKKTIDLGEGAEITLEYYPRRITLNLSEQIKAAESEREIVRLFFSVVKSWDILGDDGKPLPINDETLGDLGADILGDILTALQNADVPKAESSSD